MSKHHQPATEKDLRITARDREILAHVARNRLTTVGVVRKRFAPDRHPAAVGKLLRRLCRARLLNKYPLHGSKVYFVLGRSAARSFGLPSGRCRPLGPQALPVEFALLQYVSSPARVRRRLTRDELSDRFGWLPRSLAAAAHCLDESHPEQPRLELVRVDLGSRPDHLGRKAIRDVLRRKRYREFETLTAAGRFRLVILTTTSLKAKAIGESLRQRAWPREVPVHVAAVSELVPLLGGNRHAT